MIIDIGGAVRDTSWRKPSSCEKPELPLVLDRIICQNCGEGDVGFFEACNFAPGGGLGNGEVDAATDRVFRLKFRLQLFLEDLFHNRGIENSAKRRPLVEGLRTYLRKTA